MRELRGIYSSSYIFVDVGSDHIFMKTDGEFDKLANAEWRVQSHSPTTRTSEFDNVDKWTNDFHPIM